MGAAISNFIQWFWILVAAVKQRDLSQAALDAHSHALTQALSPATALKAMPRLLETKPWRHCTDAHGKNWAIGAHGHMDTGLDARGENSIALAGMEVMQPEWIVVNQTGLDVVAKKAFLPEDMVGLYNVLWLEAWAQTHESAGASSTLQKRASNALQSQTVDVQRQLLSAVEKIPVRGEVEEVETEDASLGKVETAELGMDRVMKHYRSVLDVKPGVFQLQRDGEGEVELKCPEGM